MTRIRRTVAGLLTIGLALPLLSGCGSRTGTVTGIVRYQGVALPGGSIIIYCDDEQILAGVIGEDGSYTIAGVPEGRAVLTVVTLPRVPEGMQLKQKLPRTTADGPRAPGEGAYSKDRPVVLPRRYATREESGLSVLVARGTQVCDIDLKP